MKNKAIVNAQTIELTIMNCMADIAAQNDEVYDGVTIYTDALGMQKTVPNVSDTCTTIGKDGSPVTIHSITVADAAGINDFNDIFGTITYKGLNGKTVQVKYYEYDKIIALIKDEIM
jgi:hypothetical protein